MNGIEWGADWAEPSPPFSICLGVLIDVMNVADVSLVSVFSMSTDPDSRTGFGPYLQGVGPVYDDGGVQKTVRYGVIEDLQRALELHGQYVAAFLIEPIQGEAGYVSFIFKSSNQNG